MSYPLSDKLKQPRTPEEWRKLGTVVDEGDTGERVHTDESILFMVIDPSAGPFLYICYNYDWPERPVSALPVIRADRSAWCNADTGGAIILCGDN